MFDEAVVGIEQLLVQNSNLGQTYLADWKGGRVDHKMDHLDCFAGGMFALAGSQEDRQAGGLADSNRYNGRDTWLAAVRVRSGDSCMADPLLQVG